MLNKTTYKMEDDKKSFSGITNNYYGTVNNVINNFVTTKHNEPHPDESIMKKVPHFPLNKTKDEGVTQYNFLTEHKYMKASLDSWLFLMGFVTEQPNIVVPITWLTTKEQLRTMLFLSFEKLISDKSIKKVDIEKLVPDCFINKDGKTMNLAKPKKENSIELDNLINFFRPSSDL